MSLRAVAGSSGGGLSGSAGALTLTLAGNGAVLGNNTFYFTISAPFGFTINSLTARAGVGSFTANVRIGTTSVTGLGAVAVSSPTPATTNASAANTVVAGNIVNVVVTGATGSPTDCVAQLNVTRA